MSARLPVRFDPYQFVSNETILHGELPIKQFERLSDALVTSTGSVDIALQFHRIGSWRNCVSGDCKTKVILICQRCLRECEHQISSEIRLGFVDKESSLERLPDDIEPFMMNDEKTIHLVDLLEDDLLLQIPLTPMHANRDNCDPDMTKYEVSEAEEPEAPKRENPFSVLKKL